MKKTKNEKLSLSVATVRKLSNEELRDTIGAGSSYSGCLPTSTCYTKLTTLTICQ